MLCVVMEKKYDNPSAWFGKLKADLGDSLFVSMSGDLNEERYLKGKIDEIVEQLKIKGIGPSQTRKQCSNCTITVKVIELNIFMVS